MHQEVRDFLQKTKEKYPLFFKEKKVLELGSMNWNGTPRCFFEDCDYTGIDINNGPGVDIICSAHLFSEGVFDVIITTEMLEHDKYWEESILNAKKLLVKGGLLIGTAANINREPHCLELGYYRNISSSDIKNIFGNKIEIEEDKDKNDIRFIWFKK